MIDCSKCLHNEVCANKIANDGLGGECGFFKAEQPQGDSISREALKRAACVKFYTTPYYKHILDLIDNAPTLPPDMAQVLAYESGYHQAKEDVIHSIAKQYIEHNELVPIWLSIGDVKGGEK